MNNVMTWVRGNLAIVVFIVIMLGAAIAMPIIAGKLNASVREEVERRAKKQQELAAIEKTPFSPPGAPGESTPVLVNQNLLDQYRAAIELQKGDAQKIVGAAVEHNRKERGVLMPSLFPEPPLAQAEILPGRFHEALLEAYDELLTSVNAGTPPDVAEVHELLLRRQNNFLNQMLGTESLESLDDQQREELRKELVAARTYRYVQAAEQLSLYASRDVLQVPQRDPTRLPTMAELFEWQWDYWVQEDLLRAIAACNGDDHVIDATVKRIVGVGIAPQGLAGAAAPTGGGGSGFGGFGLAGSGGGGGGGGDAAPAAAPANPAAEAPRDFAASITGRRTNPLYDVRYVDLVVIVDSDRLPRLFDALAAENFISAVDLVIDEADAFADLQQGYYYGSGSVVRAQMKLETVWLRTWTRQYMPPAVREQLGIAPDPPAAPGQPG